MKKILFLLIALFIISCDNSTQKLDSSGDKDSISNDNDIVQTEKDFVANENDSETTDADSSGFNIKDPGYTATFFIITMNMLGQDKAIVSGVVQKTAREDLETKTDDFSKIPIDSCIVEDAKTATPQCQSDADCAPEQKCVKKKDKDGKEIEGSDHCATPDRESLDIGPVEISGFTSGTQIFKYEPNDQVYKLNGTGDGSVDIALLKFNADYKLNAKNPTPKDLDSFSGETNMFPQLKLLSHKTHQSSMGMPAITFDLSKNIDLKWTKSSSENIMKITVSGTEKTLKCRVKDDGEFSIPQNLISQIKFGTGFQAMANMLNLDRKKSFKITGKNITTGSFDSEEILLVNIELKK